MSAIRLKEFIERAEAFVNYDRREAYKEGQRSVFERPKDWVEGAGLGADKPAWLLMETARAYSACHTLTHQTLLDTSNNVVVIAAKFVDRSEADLFLRMVRAFLPHVGRGATASEK